MLNVAYLTNEFPLAVEPYVVDEIWELRQAHAKVIPTSVRRPKKIPIEFPPGLALVTRFCCATAGLNISTCTTGISPPG